MSEYLARVKDLDLAVIKTAEGYDLVEGGTVVRSCKSDTLAIALMEALEDERLEQRPEVKQAREKRKADRADFDYYAMRRESSGRAQSKARGTGGKGGRGGL
ncbi:hypothetical protein [Dietzia sp. MNB45]|uniref:hypothetical protein n=1 Tax=Dietzia sp. MNB45 TaxID=3238800 RepID=UPI003F7CFE46